MHLYTTRMENFDPHHCTHIRKGLLNSQYEEKNIITATNKNCDHVRVHLRLLDMTTFYSTSLRGILEMQMILWVTHIHTKETLVLQK